MDYERLFALENQSWRRTTWAQHTQTRFLETAGDNFSIPTELEDFTVAAIILHDIR